MKLKVALLQLLPTGTQKGNLEKGIAACKKARDAGADIALFPEMWNIGYTIPSAPAELTALSITHESDFVQAFTALAAELNMAIGITYLETYQPRPRNTLCLIDRFGRIQFRYAKVHTCDFGDECVLLGGDDFYVADLDTAAGSVKVGAMICYDREFPESARILMLKGAEIILVPNACLMEINRISQLRGRAFENMVGIATVNYPAGQPDCNGHSTAFDGIAYVPDLPGSRDTLLLETPEEDGIYLAEFDLDAMRDYRSREVHGNAYRRPSKYRLLSEEKVAPPFLRGDARR